MTDRGIWAFDRCSATNFRTPMLKLCLPFKNTRTAMRQIFLDTETTGLSPAQGHCIVEIACVEWVDGAPSGRVFHHCFNPQRKVPDEAIAIHGLTDAFLDQQP